MTVGWRQVSDDKVHFFMGGVSLCDKHATDQGLSSRLRYSPNALCERCLIETARVNEIRLEPESFDDFRYGDVVKLGHVDDEFLVVDAGHGDISDRFLMLRNITSPAPQFCIENTSKSRRLIRFYRRTTEKERVVHGL